MELFRKNIKYILIIIFALIVAFLIYKFGAENGTSKLSLKDDFKESKQMVDTCLKLMKIDSVEVLVYPLTVEISTDKTRMHGFIKPHPYKKHSYIIYLRKNIPKHKKIEIICHELIHLQQLESRKLEYLYRESYLWKGVKYKYTEIPYENRAYEVEAETESYIYAKKLKKIFLK